MTVGVFRGETPTVIFWGSGQKHRSLRSFLQWSMWPQR